MAKDFQISAQVCEQLAQQLVSEQVEVLKHQGIVDQIKKTILEKKTEVIREVVDGRMFRYEGKRFILLNLSSFEADNCIFVMMDYFEYPTKAIEALTLTRKEKVLLEEYEMAFSLYMTEHEKIWEQQLFSIAAQLGKLKNGIRLHEGWFRTFSFEDASNPDFFRKSGIYLGYKPCPGIKGIMLEDVRMRQHR